METQAALEQSEILDGTLFHIQINRCQYIDSFPEKVANVFKENMNGHLVNDFKEIRDDLSEIETNFFKINKKRINEEEFYRTLYERITKRARRA
ncbi:MAG: hypothetical protein KGY80_09085 [Candidatus Thorarchaeota archaeon]|nr:hypothetical protein [Candidatus Thorarchaeota archaeon]